MKARCLIPDFDGAIFSSEWREALWAGIFTAAPPRQRRSVAIQRSEESLRTLAKRYDINQKTVAKWKKRGSVEDLLTGPRETRSTVLSLEEETIIVAFSRHYIPRLFDRRTKRLVCLLQTIP